MAHSPSALAQHHLDTAPFFDSTNLPNSDEDLVVEFSVPVNTVNSSGQTVSVLHLPLQVPQEQLALDDTTAAVQLHQEHERHQTTSLTSSSVTGPCSRPGTPVPREPAEEGSLGERHLLSTVSSFGQASTSMHC